MSVVIKNLVKIYGEQRAVDNISFEVKKGEVVGFLGPNGAGKSTTMKITTGYIAPTSGTVEVAGLDVQQQTEAVKKKIGYLPESNPLYFDMYIKEYLEYAGKIYGLKGTRLTDRIGEMIDLTGLTKEQNKKIGQLSKGYKQRVGLAQALIHDPEVLILDEPTNGFDPNQLIEIRKLIKETSKEKTVILSTHIMQEVQMMCDRVVIINAGKIVADNNIANLTTEIKTGYKIFIQLAGNPQKEALSNIKDVSEVKELGGGKFEVISNIRDVREDLFALTVANNWAMLEMKMEEISLEQVFQSLTR